MMVSFPLPVWRCCSVTLAPSDFLDAVYFMLGIPKGSNRIERSRFERSGIFDPASSGTGGALIYGNVGSNLVIFEFVNSEWVANAAQSGPAVYVQFGTFSLSFRGCIFR